MQKSKYDTNAYLKYLECEQLCNFQLDEDRVFADIPGSHTAHKPNIFLRVTSLVTYKIIISLLFKFLFSFTSYIRP